MSNGRFSKKSAEASREPTLGEMVSFLDQFVSRRARSKAMLKYQISLARFLSDSPHSVRYEQPARAAGKYGPSIEEIYKRYVKAGKFLRLR